MAKQRLTDDGGRDILDIYVSAGGFVLKLFVDAGSPADEQVIHEYAAGGGYVQIDLDAYTSNAAALVAGVPTFTWDDVTFTFTGPLTNTTNKAVKGVSLWRDTTIITEQLLTTPYTPVAGGFLKVTPLLKLGNVPGYTADPA